MKRKAFTLKYNFTTRQYVASDKSTGEFIMQNPDKEALYDLLNGLGYTMQYMPR